MMITAADLDLFLEGSLGLAAIAQDTVAALPSL
jgi:hypothetical protein